MSRRELRPVPSNRPPLDTCHFCHSLVYMVQVAGHLQCPKCNNVTESCCEGTTLAKTSEVAAQ